LGAIRSQSGLLRPGLGPTLYGACQRDHFAAYLTDDEPPELAFYCSECAEREFRD
jgi:hypothetical protein